MIRSEEGCDTTRGCNAAFYHIGGGRGTRPNRRKDIQEADDSWVFYGTPAYEPMRQRFKRHRETEDAAAEAGGVLTPQVLSAPMSQPQPQLQPQAPDWATQQKRVEDYQRTTAARNELVFTAEKARRQQVRRLHYLKHCPCSLTLRSLSPTQASTYSVFF